MAVKISRLGFAALAVLDSTLLKGRRTDLVVAQKAPSARQTAWMACTVLALQSSYIVEL